VRRFGDIALLVVQWALVLLGLYLMALALHLRAMETDWANMQDSPLLGEDFYILPGWQRFVMGMTMGVISFGLGALLFYLRRLYLSSRQ
jgi:hypothetical protein